MKYKNKVLMTRLVTTGPNPEIHGIAQIVMWPHIPPVFRFTEKALCFFQTIFPEYRQINKAYVKCIGYGWLLESPMSDDVIKREAVGSYAAWQSVVDYVDWLYHGDRSNIIIQGVPDDESVLPFVWGLYQDYLKIIQTDEHLSHEWPFVNCKEG